MYRYFEELPQSGWHLTTGISVESTVQTQPDWPWHESHSSMMVQLLLQSIIQWPDHWSHVMPDHFRWGSLEDNTCKNNSHAQNTIKSPLAQP